MAPLGAPEPVQHQARHDRVAAEVVLERRTRRDQYQHARACRRVQRHLHERERGRIDPVRILDDPQHRSGSGKARQLVDQRLEHPGAQLLRAEAERPVTRTAVEPQQRRDQRRLRGHVRRSERQQRPRACRGAPSVAWRRSVPPAPDADLTARCRCDRANIVAMRVIHVRQDSTSAGDARLADPRSPVSRIVWPARTSLLPALEQQRQLLFAADDLAQPARTVRREPASTVRSPATYRRRPVPQVP
jgi:hypothetical protein